MLYLFRAGASRTPELLGKATITRGHSPLKALSLLPYSFSDAIYKLLKLSIKTYLPTIHAQGSAGHVTPAASGQPGELLGEAQVPLPASIATVSLLLRKTALQITVPSSGFEGRPTEIQL